MYGSSVASGTSLNCFAFETVSICIKDNRGGEVEDFKEKGSVEVRLRIFKEVG